MNRVVAVLVAACAHDAPPPVIAPPRPPPPPPPVAIAPVPVPVPVEDPLVAVGREVYETKGCIACHTIDGTRKIGPTFKGIWGHTVTTTQGESVQVDEAYVRESVLAPSAKIVDGYVPAMPTYEISDPQLAGVIALIKSLE